MNMGEVMQGVAADISFSCKESRSDSSPPKMELVAKEAAELIVHQQRMSVRDLANKFENDQAAAQAAAARLAEDAKLQDALLLDNQVILKNLQSLLYVLGGRVAGRNKDDVEDALTLVKALEVQMLQREAEVSREMTDAHNMAALFKEASDDARKTIEEARAIANAQIDAVRDVIETLAEQENVYNANDKKELQILRLEVQEARRIKMLHEPSKVMDMDHKVKGMQQLLDEKTAELVRLRKELLESQRQSDTVYRLEGSECLGSALEVTASGKSDADDLSMCTFQWYRVASKGGKEGLISGAIKCRYAPEPFDVGRILRVEISSTDGKKESLSTSGSIDPAPGLSNCVEALARKGCAEFKVIIVQFNGEYIGGKQQCIHTFEVGRMRLKLCSGRTIKFKEAYCGAMQVCGARGGGEGAALGMFCLVKKGVTYMLAFESERERNAAIMLARRFAFDCNVLLTGPNDKST